MKLRDLAKTVFLWTIGMSILLGCALNELPVAKRWLDRTGG